MIDKLTQRLRDEWRSFIADAVRPQRVAGQPQDEVKLIQRMSAGAEVLSFLQSETVQMFIAKQEAQLTAKLLALPLDDDDGRRRLAIAVQTVRQLNHYMIEVAQDARLAENELERLRRPRAVNY